MKFTLNVSIRREDDSSDRYTTLSKTFDDTEIAFDAAFRDVQDALKSIYFVSGAKYVRFSSRVNLEYMSVQGAININKISAIKAYRAATGCGLKNAKDQVEQKRAQVWCRSIYDANWIIQQMMHEINNSFWPPDERNPSLIFEVVDAPSGPPSHVEKFSIVDRQGIT